MVSMQRNVPYTVHPRSRHCTVSPTPSLFAAWFAFRMTLKKQKFSNPGKVGRPCAFGPAQCAHFNSRQSSYDSMRDAKKSQKDMSDFLNDELFLFFSIYGWENPEYLSAPPSVAIPSAELIAQRKTEAKEAEQQVKREDATEAHREQDRLVKRVRAVSISLASPAAFAATDMSIRTCHNGSPAITTVPIRRRLRSGSARPVPGSAQPLTFRSSSSDTSRGRPLNIYARSGRTHSRISRQRSTEGCRS